jgi:ribonuclease P protein component
VLPRQSRMVSSAEFSTTVRQGRRCGRALLTVHLLARPSAGEQAPRAGFVVARSVGAAVVRNKVRRRLRSVTRVLLPSLPAGSLLVVRAHPRAANARQADLAADMSRAVQTLLRQVGAGL